MGTHALTSSTDLPLTKISAKQGSVLEVEVPAEGQRYFLELDPTQDAHFIFHLRHPDSLAIIKALVTATGEQTPSLRTEVIHHSPRTQADTLVKTLSSDKAKPAYTGLIRIEPGAHGSESYLNHHSLIVSPAAASRSIPSLEILADDVKCSHAATIRTITENDLFYLRSRGISAAEAREIMIQAFLAEFSE